MLHKMTDEQWDEVLAVDLTGTFYATRKALQVMRQQPGGGSIIGISSLSWRGSLGQANYAAAKAGLVGLTLTTAQRGWSLRGEGERHLPWLHRDGHDASALIGDVGLGRGPDTARSCRRAE